MPPVRPLTNQRSANTPVDEDLELGLVLVYTEDENGDPVPITPDGTGSATEATLLEVRDHVDQLEAKLDTILAELSQKFEQGQTAVVSPSTIVIDSNNTTEDELIANDDFVGTGTDILLYNEVVINIFARPSIIQGDLSSAKASFYFEFSKDNTNWDVSVPHVIRDPGLVIPIPIINVHKYFRVRYLNDGGASAIAALGLNEDAGTPTTQTIFRLTTYLIPWSTKELTRTMDQGISKSDPVVLTRGAIMGENPEGGIDNIRANGINTDNSTTTPLGIDGVFTGEIFSAAGYVSGFIVVNADRASAADGIELQFSDTEAFTAIRSSQLFTYSALDLNTGVIFPFTVAERFMRVKYTNGGTAQAVFFLATFLHISPVEQPRKAIETSLDGAEQAITTRSVLFASNGTSYGNIERGPNGGLAAHLDSLRSIKCTNQSVGTTAAQVTPTPLTGRRAITVKNEETNGVSDVIHIGEGSGVTDGSGFVLGRGADISMEVDDTATIYAIASGAGVILSIIEAAE